MAMVVKNNMSAVRTLSTLNKNNTALQDSLSKVSSGLKINTAKDDASGYAISERMRVQIRSLDQANQNSQNASSLMKNAEGAVERTIDILRTLKQKAIDAASDTNTDDDRATIQKELDQLIDQIDDNALITFNGKYLLEGSRAQSGSAVATHLTNNSLATNTNLLSTLGSLSNRNGESIEINSSDRVTVSFVMGGRTYVSTLTSVSNDTRLGDIYKMLNTAINGTNTAGSAFAEITVSDSSSSGLFGASNLEWKADQALTTAFLIGGQPAAADTWSNSKAYAPKDSEGNDVANISGVDEEKGIRGAEDDTLYFEIAGTNYTSGNLTGQITSNTKTIDFLYGGETHTINLGTGGDSNTAFSTDASLAHYATTGVTTKDGKGLNIAAWIDNTHTNTDQDSAGNALNNILIIKIYQTEFIATDAQISSTTSIGNTPAGKELVTADGYNALTFHASSTGLEGQISGLSISISDSEGNVKKATNTALDAFKTSIYAANETADGAVSFQLGSSANQAVKVGLMDMRSEALGLKGRDGTTIKITTRAAANAAISAFDNALNKALDQQTTIGAISSRLDYTASNLTTSSENVQAAESTIRDADMAKEMTNYTKNNVLLQAAQSMLAQANQNSSAVLSLLQ